MLREMRRRKQQMTEEESIAVLERGTSGVLALSGDDGYPYAVPLSYIYHEGKLYFHCAKQGHKIDALQREPKASFCVIDQDEIHPEKYTTHFRSVIAFGAMRIMEDPEEKRAAMERLALKYAPQDDPVHRQQAIDREWTPLCVLEMTICHLTGKQALELAKPAMN